MSKLIADHNLPLGTTADGKNWCLKALHPSDPISTGSGIPDESSVPSVFMNYQTSSIINTTLVDGTWGFQMSVTPNPVSFGCYRVLHSSGATSDWLPIYNSQLPGNSHSDKFMSFRTQCERWRLAYMSVTLQQDAPALSDQGHIAACQSVFSPARLNFGYKTNGFTWASRSAIATSVGDSPTFEQLQSMPGAYYTNSKEGCYMPLKLTRTCQNWRNDATNVYLHPGDMANDPYRTGSVNIPVVPGADTNNRYPYPGLATLVLPDGGPLQGNVTSDLCNDVVGHICATNLSPTTRFTIFVRAGYELQVLPGSILTPQQVMPAEYDETALMSYFAISRKMKDAYPADYNDLGKIWDVISGLAKSILPKVSLIPGIPGALAKGLTMGVDVIDNIRGLSSVKGMTGALQRQKQGIASLDDIQKLRAAVTIPKTQVRKKLVITRPKERKLTR